MKRRRGRGELIRVWIANVEVLAFQLNVPFTVSNDYFRLGSRNVSHQYQQRPFSRLPSPERTNYTIKCYPRVQNIYGIYSVRWLKATLPWLTSSFHWKRELFQVSAPVLRLSRKFDDLALLAQLVSKNNSTCTKFTYSALIQIQNSSPTCPRSHDLRTWHKFLGDCRFS